MNMNPSININPATASISKEHGVVSGIDFYRIFRNVPSAQIRQALESLVHSLYPVMKQVKVRSKNPQDYCFCCAVISQQFLKVRNIHAETALTTAVVDIFKDQNHIDGLILDADDDFKADSFAGHVVVIIREGDHEWLFDPAALQFHRDRPGLSDIKGMIFLEGPFEATFSLRHRYAVRVAYEVVEPTPNHFKGWNAELQNNQFFLRELNLLRSLWEKDDVVQ